jgi:hypothetical protein
MEGEVWKETAAGNWEEEKVDEADAEKRRR